MRILHTSDWHLGKSTLGCLRIEEQKAFIHELNDLIQAHNIDILLVSGDIYDNQNPSPESESLYYYAMDLLTKDREIVIFLIPGNHDNPKRLEAPFSFLYQRGIIVGGNQENIEPGDYGFYQIIRSEEYFTEMIIKGEKVVVVHIPYISEKRLNQLIFNEKEEGVMRLQYSDKLKEIIEEGASHFTKDSINIVMAHLFALGGAEGGGEKSIQLGGSFLVDRGIFPEEAHYIALGHLHKPQKISSRKHIYYSGTPIQYHIKEAGQSKSVYIITIDNQNTDVSQVYLTNYKPLENWKAENIEEAILLCEKRQNDSCYVNLTIQSHRPLMQHEQQLMKKYKEDILSIHLVLKKAKEIVSEEKKDISLKDDFVEFYQEKKQVPPSEEMIQLFLSIAEEL